MFYRVFLTLSKGLKTAQKQSLRYKSQKGELANLSQKQIKVSEIPDKTLYGIRTDWWSDKGLLAGLAELQRLRQEELDYTHRLRLELLKRI